MDELRIKELIDKISMPEDEEVGVYKEAEVTLNKPFASDDKEKALAVYAKNSLGDTVLVRFLDRSIEDVDSDEYKSSIIENYKCDVQKDMSTPSFWMCRVVADDAFSFADKSLDHGFNHQVFFDFQDKTVKSVRDGVQEYYGAELGLEPYDKVFTVYREPTTITSLVSMMDKLPIIEDHIDPKLTPNPETIQGLIEDTEIVEYTEDFKDSTLYLKNKVAINDKGLETLSRGKRQLSLGYLGKLKEHDVYDFEQYDLKPTHLAMVDRARGGDILSFEDKQKQKEQDMNLKDLKFIDADGKMSLQLVAEIVSKFQEAIKNAPLEDVQKLLPQLQELVNSANSNSGMSEEGESTEMAEAGDMEGEMKEEIKTEDMGNHGEYEDGEDKEGEKDFSDSQAFKDAVKNMADTEAKEIFKTVEKAKDFLDESYSFEDKSAFQIKKDAVEKELGKSFEDSKVEGAFEALQKTNAQYTNFGDSANDKWAQLKKEDKEL